MSESAAAPALPPEALALIGLLGKAFAGLPSLDLGIGEGEDTEAQAARSAALRLAKALPFSVLLWVRAFHASGELKALAAREREEARAAGVEEDDLETAVLLAFGVVLAKNLQDALIREAEKR